MFIHNFNLPNRCKPKRLTLPHPLQSGISKLKLFSKSPPFMSVFRVKTDSGCILPPAVRCSFYFWLFTKSSQISIREFSLSTGLSSVSTSLRASKRQALTQAGTRPALSLSIQPSHLRILLSCAHGGVNTEFYHSRTPHHKYNPGSPSPLQIRLPACKRIL